MRRWKVLAALGVMALGVMPALGAEEGDGSTAKWDWFGSLRVRPEYNDNLSDSFLGRDDKIGYIGYRANLGTQISLDRDVNVLFDVQGLGAAGEDYTPVKGGSTIDYTYGKLSLYRAYIEAKQLFGEKLDLRLGRQEVVLGDEWLAGDNDFYGGLSWDAARADIGNRWGTLSFVWAKVADFDNPEFLTDVLNSEDNTGDWDFYVLYQSMKFGKNVELDLGILYNFNHTSLEFMGGPSYIDKRFTYTARYAYNPATGFFAKANVAIQDGRTVDENTLLLQDANADAYEVVGGWRWERNGRMSKVYGLIADFSGDDPGTEDVETFNPLAQDYHNRYGMLDFWNGTWGRTYIGGSPGFRAIQLGFESEIPNGITLMGVAQRMMRNTEIGPTATNKNLGQEFGVAARYAYGNNLTLDFCFAQLFPGTAIGNEEPLFGKSTSRRLYVGATAKF